jgi:hypothetical protein
MAFMTTEGEALPSDLRRARHTMRGKLNALKLCISALPTCETPAEAAEFLVNIEQETDKLICALDEFEALQAAHMNDG